MQQVTAARGASFAVTDKETCRRMSTGVGKYAMVSTNNTSETKPLAHLPPRKIRLRSTRSTASSTSLHHQRRHSCHILDLISTEQLHKSDDMEFYGPYADIRKTLDYSYHCNYNEERQRLQDSIVNELLKCAKITNVNGGIYTIQPTEPWIVFTAGAMGVGKSYTIRRLAEKGRFPICAFVIVDPDEIRRHLPDFRVYAQRCPELAGELTRKEAGYIAEISIIAALQAGKNVLVDGSLRDAEWYKEYFEHLKREYTLKIAILHVTAPREAVFQRAANRAKETGRVVPRRILEKALEQVPKSVKSLCPLADYFCELKNAPHTDDIEIVTEGESWDSFRHQWLKTCASVRVKTKKAHLQDTKTMPARAQRGAHLELLRLTPVEKQEVSVCDIFSTVIRNILICSFLPWESKQYHVIS